MAEAAFRVYLTSYRQVIEQRRKRLEIQQALRRGEKEHNQQIFARLKAHYQGSSWLPRDVVVIPSGHHQQVPLPLERIENYRKHLEKVIAEAMTYASVDEAPHDNNKDAYEKLQQQEQLFADQPRLKEVSDAFCMLCKGGCCARGQEHAYLSASHMRRLMDQDPAWSPESLLLAYMSALAQTSSDNACINQGPAGCVLPRELRSSTCNQFYCSAVKKYQAGITDENSDANSCDEAIGNVAVIQREQSLWNRSYNDEPNEVPRVAILATNRVTRVSLLSQGNTLEVDQVLYAPEGELIGDE
jgi:hypothetical protein